MNVCAVYHVSQGFAYPPLTLPCDNTEMFGLRIDVGPTNTSCREAQRLDCVRSQWSSCFTLELEFQSRSIALSGLTSHTWEGFPEEGEGASLTSTYVTAFRSAKQLGFKLSPLLHKFGLLLHLGLLPDRLRKMLSS